MNTNYIISILISGCITLNSCEKNNQESNNKVIDLTKSQKEMVGSSNSFGYKLFKEVADPSNPAENYFVSPLSVTMALTMTYNGAAGATKDSMQNTLGYTGLSDDDINKSGHELMNWLLKVDPKVQMDIANSIWCEETHQILPAFLNVNQTYFDAQVLKVNFRDPGTINIINQWVSDKTNQKITQIIDNIPDETIMYLINAIYFKGTWKYQFDKTKTSKQTFYLNDGSTLQTDFMTQKGDFKYASNSILSAIELPYGDGNYSMLVLVPKQGNTCQTILNNLNDLNWNNWNSELKVTEDVQVYLPKFKFSFETRLNKTLKNMGMSIAFSDTADFSKINGYGNLKISNVIHKSYIDVNEEGTEAAAVTSVEIGITCQPLNETIFRADKPFIFAIKEKQTNAILFIGLLNKPVLN